MWPPGLQRVTSLRTSYESSARGPAKAFARPGGVSQKSTPGGWRLICCDWAFISYRAMSGAACTAGMDCGATAGHASPELGAGRLGAAVAGDRDSRLEPMRAAAARWSAFWSAPHRCCDGGHGHVFEPSRTWPRDV